MQQTAEITSTLPESVTEYRLTVDPVSAGKARTTESIGRCVRDQPAREQAKAIPFADGISSRGIEILRVLNLMFNDLQQGANSAFGPAVVPED